MNINSININNFNNKFFGYQFLRNKMKKMNDKELKNLHINDDDNDNDDHKIIELNYMKDIFTVYSIFLAIITIIFLLELIIFKYKNDTIHRPQAGYRGGFNGGVGRITWKLEWQLQWLKNGTNNENNCF